MRCSAARQRLTQYIYGDLTEREAQAVRSHLSECVSCSEIAAETRGVLSLVSRYKDLSPPRDVYLGLRKEVAARSRGRRFSLPLLLRPLPAYVAATAMAVLAIASGVSTKMEVARLERMNSLLSDSLRILNMQSLSAPLSDLSDSSSSLDTIGVPGLPPGD